MFGRIAGHADIRREYGLQLEEGRLLAGSPHPSTLLAQELKNRRCDIGQMRQTTTHVMDHSQQSAYAPNVDWWFHVLDCLHLLRVQ